MPKDSTRFSNSSSKSFRTQPYPTRPTQVAPMETIEGSPVTTPENSHAAFAITSPSTERASTAWTDEDDARLMRYRAANMNWIAIAQHFPGKTGNACRKRHERLVEKRNAMGFDGVRLADLATAYMECREQMWRLVAERVGGEKWQTIEQKCMEKGFKTLSSAARTARRAQASTSAMIPQLDASSDVPPYEQFRESFYDETVVGGKPATPYDTYQFGPAPSQEMSTVFYTHPQQAAGHSRRASAAHSVAHSVEHSSRSNSHGPMQPPQANNPFASPQPFFAANGMAMPPTLSSQNYPPTTLSNGMHMQQAHPQNSLPSISNTFEMPRLPSIIGTQG